MTTSPPRILITGGSGFVGSRVAALLAAQGLRPALILRHPDSPRLRPLSQTVTIIPGDLMHTDSYADAVRAYAPDTLLHLGWTDVTGAGRDAVTQLDNIGASARLLDIARAAGLRHFIGLGSQAEYGPQNGILDETAPCQPVHLYGHAKAASYAITRHLCAQAQIRHAWIRLFSAYGPGDNPAFLIPSLIAAWRRGAVPDLTACEQKWDYLHVDDAARAIVAVATTPSACGVFNLGAGRAYELRQIVTLLRDLWDPAAPIGFGARPYAADQIMHLEAAIGRLTAATHWRPEIDIETGLRQTVAFYKDQASADPVRS